VDDRITNIAPLTCGNNTLSSRTLGSFRWRAILLANRRIRFWPWAVWFQSVRKVLPGRAKLKAHRSSRSVGDRCGSKKLAFALRGVQPVPATCSCWSLRLVKESTWLDLLQAPWLQKHVRRHPGTHGCAGCLGAGPGTRARDLAVPPYCLDPTDRPSSRRRRSKPWPLKMHAAIPLPLVSQAPLDPHTPQPVKGPVV